MYLRRFYDEALAHASYLVGCQETGEACVIDPARDVEPYLHTAKREGLRIVAALETHIHADFVSGARELAGGAGAAICVSDEGPPEWKSAYVQAYPHRLLRDGDELRFGHVRLVVMHTPGHTPEHVSYLLYDGKTSPDVPMALFSGDFVFVGDVGRPDLLERVAGESGSSEALARQMFRSLRKFEALPDHVQVLPAHGAGSACGKALGAVPSSTVGYEKLVNWALQHQDEDAFVQALLAGQPEAPVYFARMKQVNKNGPRLLKELSAPARAALSPEALRAWRASGIVLDVRPADAFAKRHLAGSLNIPWNKSFVTWAGWLLPADRHIHLLAADGIAPDVIRALRSIGIDDVADWADPAEVEGAAADDVASYVNVTPDDVRGALAQQDIWLLDVRNADEWAGGHLPQAHHIPLSKLAVHIQEVPREASVYVYCRTGGRSAIAASLLRAHGVEDVRNMLGGYEAWRGKGFPVEA
ncbi:MBL fold metallo-hydrolase [Alicyclobacillus mali (ex Roth et al. 2021)]|uniref:MBL fold metallo-hydrolase n=1 Tax=Alicyclobacillus mali (ex Roth et al. 2021) TaxID=1123961 RepID=UPI000831B905|nr:MBL fold metallo-hydrolase [Alicyclobacillus mali (ex Roth et al. 2021)]